MNSSPAAPPAAPNASAATGNPWPRVWLVGLGLGLGASVGRAVLFALVDGYWQRPELTDLASRSLLQDLLRGALWALPVTALAAVLLQRGRPLSTLLRGLAALLLLVAGGLFLTGRWPASPFHVPGTDSLRAQLAQAAAWGGALVLALLLVWRPAARCSSRPSRSMLVCASAALALFAWLAALAWSGWTLLQHPAPSTTETSPPHLVLLSLDTLRHDRLNAPLSPTLAALGQESVRFERAYSPQPFTLTAHMTMLTGLSPSVHSLAPEQALPARVVTLAQSLREQGWITAAFVDTVTWLHPRYGFDRGFSIYRQIEGDLRSKQEQIRLLLDDLGSVGSRPVFLFVHLYDAHSDESVLPYEAAPDFMAEHAGWYDGDFTGCVDGQGCASELLLDLNKRGQTLEGDDRRYLASLYDAGVATLDHRLKTLFAQLREDDFLDHSVLMVTADHGEEFFEHGRALHDQNYEESVRVPLMVRMPGAAARGIRSELVGLADLAPTLRELAGLPPQPSTGQSFAALLSTRDAAAARAERGAVWLDAGRGSLGIVTQRWKLFPTRASYEFYDLANDPEEQHDLFEQAQRTLAPESTSSEALEAPEALLALQALIDAARLRVAEHRLALGLPADPAASADTTIESPLSEEALRQLESLGYTGGR